ncbi:MotA/TolQ/ExbB proton channel family protein [Lyngbya confervoides]|uniref:MotA/TolQ/ExbB proton channel family protein n=1 Tax=Lyngbya confervoides BDU141951 TaxID=1574623 RepID=A0ABD4SY90_9CYAN|nr:MotA/TolQ/ExbB proton channel family protein [Lyngbya confervoides]MCM1981307.1 MotA/TolQ/ExbB proton channel family protein [Lyngbya confervoides BDU141951]
MNIAEIFQKGGPAMWPLLFLSILTLGTIFERLWFWLNLLRGERRFADQILESARRDWDEATHLARQFSNQPIGRFLYTPLRLANKEPEVFRLALEASADEELNAMRRGDKLLEGVIAIAPMLGLLGTVLGLINSLASVKIDEIEASALSTVGAGISEALISTATGLIVAIITLAFYRLFQGLLFHQARIFRRTGNELELTYRQFWLQTQQQDPDPLLRPQLEPPKGRI